MDKKQTNKKNREWTIGPKQTKIEQKIYIKWSNKKEQNKYKEQTGTEKNRLTKKIESNEQNRLDLSFVFSIAFLYTAFYKQTSKQMTEKRKMNKWKKQK